ncbi:hypothetical protein [Halobacterium litoreum]|uniref:C2H2-type domain-containing protein n=1 Tax=Halobacterium litoreum TaxID=2039234 RepID=A0ABD5NHE2_9EURY|nr:hypothetical protein [Halobacterium litoreum]UHH12426.1 hypothetical protein LT972_09675 [Halobacterium litoreum]
MSRYLRVAVYTRSRERVHLEICPACGYDFDRDEDRHHHIADHAPEDFGLSPLGETAPDHDEPLFAGGVGD